MKRDVSGPAPAMLEMFTCTKRSMRLTAAGCAKLWTSANDPDRRPQLYEGRFACLACPIGAANAGQVIAAVAPAVEALRIVCPRCFRPSERIVAGRLCVSCYNREREALIGRNAKGGPPRLKLVKWHVAVAEAGSVRTIDTPAKSLVELMIATARTATGSIAFGRAAMAWGEE